MYLWSICPLEQCGFCFCLHGGIIFCSFWNLLFFQIRVFLECICWNHALENGPDSLPPWEGKQKSQKPKECFFLCWTENYSSYWIKKLSCTSNSSWISIFLCVKILSWEFYFLTVFTAELAPFSINYPPSNAQAAQSAYAGTVRVVMSLGATQLVWGSADLNSHVSRLWLPSLVFLSCVSFWAWFWVWSMFLGFCAVVLFAAVLGKPVSSGRIMGKTYNTVLSCLPHQAQLLWDQHCTHCP